VCVGAIIPHMASFPTPVLLASASPRRRHLLQWLGLHYSVFAPKTTESLESPLSADPPALAISLAEEKLAAALSAASAGTLILTFDTIVVLGDRLFGKPKDESDARRMLHDLADRDHQVVTGCCIRHPHPGRTDSFAVTSNVRVQKLTDEKTAEWLALGEYMGCAGAYNIERQIAGTGLRDCYQNVAGLPLCHVYARLRDSGLVLDTAEGLIEPIARCDSMLHRKCRLGPALLGSDKA